MIERENAPLCLQRGVSHMTEDRVKKVEAALRVAVEAAIAKHGVAGLKATSLFLSNERATLRKVA